jgi:hypothetical protein
VYATVVTMRDRIRFVKLVKGTTVLEPIAFWTMIGVRVRFFGSQT